MPDREKVISALECISNGAKQPCRDCEYSKREEWCIAECAKDALALLKAQEPVAPIFDYDGRDVWLCGNCHRTIFHPTRTDEDENEKNYRGFCFHCGMAVKWE